MKKKISIVMACIFTLFLFTACGITNGTANNTTPDNSVTDGVNDLTPDGNTTGIANGSGVTTESGNNNVQNPVT